MNGKPPRVVHLIDHMGSGGAQRVILDLLEARNSGAGDSVVSLRSHCRPELRERMHQIGVPYRGLGLARTNPLPVHRIRAAIRESGAEIVHTHLEFSNELGVLGVRSMGRRRPRAIVHVHNDLDRHYTWPHRLAGRAVAPFADVHVVPSASVAASTRAVFGGRVGRFEIIPYGIDSHWFSEGPTRASKSFRAGANAVIGTVARLTTQKSLHHLIDAMPTILAFRPDARLLIFGDGPLRARLSARARSRGIARAVTFAGFVPDVASAYASLDVFVLPSRNEGLPICLLEAMAMGIPIVGARVTGISDLVTDEQTGLTVPYGDPVAIARAVVRLLRDDVMRDRTRSNARKLVETRFTRAAVAQQMEGLYRALCAGDAAHSRNPDFEIGAATR